MKKNIIYNGDCIEILNKEVNEKSIDLIFADPPYNLSGNGLKWKGNKTGGDWHMVNEKWDKMSEPEYIQFTRKWISACNRVLKDVGSFYISCSYHNISEVMIVLKQFSFKVNNIITWHKTNAMPNMTRRVFTHSTEFVVWAVKGKGWIFNYEKMKEMNPEKQKDGRVKQMRDIWQLPLVQGDERLQGRSGRALHPTQKPEEMLRRIILAGTNEDDIVLDPFLGSGTTAYVAKKNGRKWIGIEKDEEYVNAAKKRLNTELNIEHKHMNSKKMRYTIPNMKPKRTKAGQKRHDEAVRRSVAQYKKLGYVVQADIPGEKQPHKIGKHIPDIIAKKGQKERVVEFETKETAKKDEKQHEAFRRYTDNKKGREFKINIIK